MEALLSRYRNLTVLLIVVVAQLLYLAYQVKTNRDERLIRVWAVSSVTPMAGVVEAVRHNTIGFLEDYFILLDVRDQNRKLKSLNDRLRMENVYDRNQLATAEHAHALTLFQARSPSKTVAARVIGNSTVVTAKAVFIDRGSTSGIEKGMAVVTPEGIVGKVAAVYPLISQVLLVTDPTFKVGVESQKGHVHGVLDCGNGKCTVEQIQNEEKVEKGEWFFTSGEDRIFPKGFPVGTVVSVQPGQGMKDIKLNLSGSPAGVDEVLVVLAGIHQSIPTAPVIEDSTAKMLPLPPPDGSDSGAATAKPQTEADKIVQKYDALGKEQGHAYGAYGSNLPNFNVKPPAAAGTAPAATSTGNPQQKAAAVPKENTPDREAAGDTEGSGPPAVLGARPTLPKPLTPKPAPRQAAPNTDNGPVLPLGAPRRKPATPPADTEPAPQQ
jgi:rod shape-determining protein MreC